MDGRAWVFISSPLRYRTGRPAHSRDAAGYSAMSSDLRIFMDEPAKKAGARRTGQPARRIAQAVA
jgi:hypothetical protein